MAVAMEATEAATAVDSVDAKPTRTASRAVEQDISALVFSLFWSQFAFFYCAILRNPLTVCPLVSTLSTNIFSLQRDCTQGQKCYSCGQTGHISRE
jgi:hypothetical protein